MHLRLVILLISFFHYSALPGQDMTTVFSTLGVNEGLPSSSVYGLYQDSKGLVWVAGPEGLSRYDGNAVSNYSPADANATFSPFFREAPLEGPDGNLWMTSESGICKFDLASKKFKTLVRLPGISRQYFLDKGGWLWLHHIDRGIMRYHIKSGRLNIFPLPFQADAMDWNSFCATTDEKERIWFCTYNSRGFYEFNIRDGIYRRLPGPPVNNLIYAAGRLYLGTSEGLVVFDVQTNKVLHTVKLPGEKNCRLKDVVIDGVGRTWAGFLGQGIISFGSNGKLLAWHRQDNHNISTLSSDLVTTLMIDRNQNLWIGTDGGGISKLNLKTVPFSKFPVSTQSYPALSSFFVRGICEDSDGNILFGAFNSGLCRLDIVTGALHIYKNAPANLKEINNITDIGGGRFLIGARTGLFLFHQPAETFTAVSLIPPAKTPAPYDHGVTGILQTGENEFVLATTLGPALLKVSGNEWYVTSTVEKRLLRKINQVHPAGNGIFYMTVANGGLWRVQLVNSEFITVDTFLAHHAIRYIHGDEEKPHVLWLATNKGVIRFDDSSHTNTAITTGNGLLSNNTYGILEDELHRLWISSNGGLACYSKDNQHIRNYTFRNGLQSNEFNSGASYKSRKGVLFFGGVKGMNWFTAATVGSDTTYPFTEITSIVADETEVLPDNNHYTIPGYKNSFTITAAVLDYTNPGANLVRYKMEGWDNDWVTAPTGTIRYTNMRSGAYTFRLVGIAGNALESAEKDISITINAPVWERRWFHFLVMALLVLIPATLLYQRRISRSKRDMEKQRLLAMERTRISQDLHDEIGGAITRIGLVSSLIPQKNKMHQDIDKEVDMIATTARQVAASMGEIVWALHTDYNTLESLLAYIREQATGLIGPSGIRLEVHFPDVVPDMQLSGEARRNLLLVTKEALNNAVKHARPTHITLNCAISKTTITFTVQDDGMGFDPATPATGNGIRNMRKRMQSVGGTIEWHKLPRGTEAVYSVTIDN